MLDNKKGYFSTSANVQIYFQSDNSRTCVERRTVDGRILVIYFYEKWHLCQFSVNVI